MNQRYSPLDEIDTDNVKDLKGVWMTAPATAPASQRSTRPRRSRSSTRATIYVPTGADDVFAVDVDSGKILWEYKAHLEQTISTVCCGWL